MLIANHDGKMGLEKSKLHHHTTLLSLAVLCFCLSLTEDYWGREYLVFEFDFDTENSFLYLLCLWFIVWKICFEWKVLLTHNNSLKVCSFLIRKRNQK